VGQQTLFEQLGCSNTCRIRTGFSQRRGKTNTMASAYDLTEVSRHNVPSNLWVASRGKVFDVTRFVGRHPGGSDVLVEHAGSDVTDVMAAMEPHRHSKCAYDLLDEYYIGDLKEGERTCEREDTTNHRSHVR